MFAIGWKLIEEENYYETEVSLEKGLTPFFRAIVVPKTDNKHELIIKDYNSRKIVTSKNVGIINESETFTDVDHAQAMALMLAYVYAEGTFKQPKD